MQNQVKIAAYSRNKQGDEMLSVLVTFPRIILSEVNTHRMLCKNTSSSRAIPFLKMVEVVENNPFIPFAFQKHHSGMQGTEYITDVMENMLAKTNWLEGRDAAITMAKNLYEQSGVTKQLCNRLLEPFMWTTMLITGSVEHGWKNFFNLRCPAYELMYENMPITFKSKKEFNNFVIKHDGKSFDLTEDQFRSINISQAEIHIQDLAEKIYDALNEATPKLLNPGDWHIPFEDEIGFVGDILYKLNTSNGIFKDYDTQNKVKISTSMAARTSYTVIDAKGTSVEKHIDLHEDLLNQNPPHSSPTEHCHRCMDENEYVSFVKGKVYKTFNGGPEGDNYQISEESQGWCYSAKGFIPYRYFIDNGYKG